MKCQKNEQSLFCIYAHQIYKTMALTIIALNHIKTNKRLRSLLALGLNRTEYTILRWADGNDDNLTKAVSMRIIREETGLGDHEILEQEPTEAADKR